MSETMDEPEKLLRPSKQNPLSEDGGDSWVEARFARFCENELSLDDNLLMQAKTLLNESKHIMLANISSIEAGMLEEAERQWFAFVLYSTKRLSESAVSCSNCSTRVNGFNLCQILRATKLKINDFLKELPQFIFKIGPILSNLYGIDWEKRLEAKEMQANFGNLSRLSKFYKHACRELFSASNANGDKQLVISGTSGYLSDYFRFGWFLFLALRVHVFCHSTDVVTNMNGLVSILAILIMHVPVCFRNFSVSDSSCFVKKGEKADLLGSLCNMFETSEDELKKTLERANHLITDLLKKKPCLASEYEAENFENIDTDGLIYFEDLMEISSLSSSISQLEKDYGDEIHNTSELDEAIFFNEEDSLLGLGSLSGGEIKMRWIGTKRKIDDLDSPAKTLTNPISHTPNVPQSDGIRGGGNTKMAFTPVCTAMTTAKWLRTVIAPLPSKPSVVLERFLSSCDRNVTAEIMQRAQIILAAILPSSGRLQNTNLLDSTWVEQRLLEVLKLYFRVLEAMCTAESQILRAQNLTSLLSSEMFHRCMLACSSEVVLAAHRTVTMLFPMVLEKTGITAFDLCKVIENFIRHEESLPRELKRHLNSLEERLLESMAWAKGSSMYNSLTVARPTFSEEISRRGLLAKPMPSLDAISAHINMSGCLSPEQYLLEYRTSGSIGDVLSPKRVFAEYRSVLVERNSFTSPVKNQCMAPNTLKSKSPPPALQPVFASPTKANPGGGGETCAEIAINMFFTKILKLAAVRISGMVERLQLSQQIRERVFCLFQKILDQQTSIFFNRHIDQIILCCFYGVAKISKLHLTFKEIIYNYQKQPHSKPQVSRCVYVDWTSACQNEKSGPESFGIIPFYNTIFVPAVKHLLVELAPFGSAEWGSHSTETRNDGLCSASPSSSPFPSIPDMSPRKVSSSHNVYVSPLRPSKMDKLISHSSKSYYACIGESTRAYQSPSKDLSAINDNLRGGRKLRGKLNFEDVDVGLIADSMVDLKSGSCASVKSEQPHS